MKKHIEISFDKVNRVNLEPYAYIVSRGDHKHNIVQDAGIQHYKLLFYLSSCIQGSIVELGTHHGTGTLALAMGNPVNNIDTFDVSDVKFGITDTPSNVCRHVGDIFDIPDALKLLDNSKLIFLDTNHDGDFEAKVYKYLVNTKYMGILLLDDIFINHQMTQFWNGIDIKKYDVTFVGHGYQNCGTGLVDFGGNVKVVYDA